jgi:hypothetical protein
MINIFRVDDTQGISRKTGFFSVHESIGPICMSRLSKNSPVGVAMIVVAAMTTFALTGCQSHGSVGYNNPPLTILPKYELLSTVAANESGGKKTQIDEVPSGETIELPLLPANSAETFATVDDGDAAVEDDNVKDDAAPATEDADRATDRLKVRTVAIRTDKPVKKQQTSPNVAKDTVNTATVTELPITIPIKVALKAADDRVETDVDDMPELTLQSNDEVYGFGIE